MRDGEPVGRGPLIAAVMPSTSYAAIDPVILAWAKHHNLTLFTKYQDYDVRSFDVPHPRKTFQLWIEVPSSDGEVTIRSCDHARPWGGRASHSMTGPAADLNRMLDEMLTWIQQHA
jgi:hypothetical protein